jgi:hypothetical protein
MTTKRIYFCNVCKDEITKKNPGIGFLFKGKNFEESWYHKAENHLCRKCILAISDLSCKVKWSNDEN